MKYKRMKVFDCQDMPDAERKSFFEDSEAGNDCYVTVYPNETDYFTFNEEGDEVHLPEPLYITWLKANGVESSGDRVIVSHWW